MRDGDNLSSKSQNSKVFWGFPAVKRIKDIFSRSKSLELVKCNTIACGGESSTDYASKKQFLVKFTSDYYNTSKENLLRNHNILSNYSSCKDIEAVGVEITPKSFKFPKNIDQLKMFLKPIDIHFQPKINYRVLALSDGHAAVGEAISKPEAPISYLKATNVQDNICSVLSEGVSTQTQRVNSEPKEAFQRMYNVAVPQQLPPKELFITFDRNVQVSELIDHDQSSDVQFLKSTDVEQGEDFWDTPKYSTRKLATPKRLVILKSSGDVDDDFTISDDTENVDSNRKSLHKLEHSLVVLNEDGSESETVNLPPITVDDNSTATLFNEEGGVVTSSDTENEVETLDLSHGQVPSKSPLHQSNFNCLEETLGNEKALLNIGYLQIPEPPEPTFGTNTGERILEEMKDSHNQATKIQNLEQEIVAKNNPHIKQECDFKIFPKSLPSRKTPNYKNVSSPVGMYIKNSPRVPQVKRIYTKSTISRPLFAKIPTSIITENKENEEMNLPNRLYKPAVHSFTTNAEDSEAKFSKKIQKLFKTTPEIIKHKGRINKKEADLDSVEEKLLKEDLTVSFSDANVLNASSASAQDVSMLSIRKAYIK